ncbi:DAP3-binding cell death enhancer 1 [Pseudolycoriella hygida]|uniref:DAP3-binding cell death enhancer 1 n=1 Tax=Pseudolycoriella hygida TaxID=35572 RepID=A0A9Q0RXL0_9DIPT|nr:DAP3-binding cell death enhancer 1 [Pseudolycoriella hygida]
MLRRIKDTVERSCNILEARRTWNFGNEGLGANDDNLSSSDKDKRFTRHLDRQRPASIFEFGLEPKVPNRNVVNQKTGRDSLSRCQRRFDVSGKRCDSKSSDKEDFRERIDNKHQCKYQRDFVDALTWTSALISGWYTSQFMCMKRRHLQRGWNVRCKYANILMQPGQAFHSGILTHLAKTAPENQNEAFVWNYNEESNKFHIPSDFYKEKYVEPVNKNWTKIEEGTIEKETIVKETVEKETSAKEKGIAPKTFDAGVQTLLHILGDIEFRLGVASVRTKRYDLAALHFESASGHSHASAAFNLGICYEEGIGVEKNLQMALECYTLASSLGHAKALYNLGVFHARGLADLPKNRETARQYFTEAAKLGVNEAKKALGIGPTKAVEPKIPSAAINRQSLQMSSTKSIVLQMVLLLQIIILVAAYGGHRQRFCGPTLTETLQILCRNKYASLRYSHDKRSASEDVEDSEYINDESNYPLLTYQPMPFAFGSTSSALSPRIRGDWAAVKRGVFDDCLK